MLQFQKYKMMGLPDVRSCCGCCSVEVGAIIIALFQLIAAMLFLSFEVKSLVVAYQMEAIDRDLVHINIILVLTISIYPILQGTLLLLGIKKKRASFLLVWLILAFIFEMFVAIGFELYLAVICTIIGLFTGHHLYNAVAVIYLSGIQIGISFFFIVIVSTCRKNILRRNALFDYGVIYTPDAVEILAPRRRTGLIDTNPQFDYSTLNSPEEQEVVVVK